MAGGGVADFIDRLHDGVEGCVVADGGVGAAEVVVDGGWNGDAGVVEFLGEDARSVDGAVTANDDEGVYLLLDEIFVGLLASFGILEVGGWGGLEDGAAILDDVADALSFKRHDVAFDETLVAVLDGFYFQPVVDG